MMVATLLEYIKEEIFYSKQYLYLVNCFVGELVYRPHPFFDPPLIPFPSVPVKTSLIELGLGPFHIIRVSLM
jgi:hypothetical protein